MKTDHPIHINRARAKEAPGGVWEERDPVARGRVQSLAVRRDPIMQAWAVMTELQRLAALSPDWDWATCAVIAREWRYLDPVRAFCEVHSIPVHLGREEIPRFWRLRETRALVAWLRERTSRLVDTAALRRWLKARPAGPWVTLLGEAADDYALETGGTAMPVSHCIEWLAEWGREVRQRQRGLLLLTAHSAKGLEFDHVAVLDGGWGRSNRDEDPDAARRLYYVAMTRARQSLVLARFAGPSQDATEQLHPLPYAFSDSPSVLSRTADGAASRAPAFARQYRRPALDKINLGFAGGSTAGHPVHRAIAALAPGDPLRVRVEESGRWTVLNRAGVVVGRLAKGFEPPAGTRCSSASVLAVVAWSRDASQPQYQDRLRCDAWEVVVPELVFEPDGRASR